MFWDYGLSCSMNHRKQCFEIMGDLALYLRDIFDMTGYYRLLSKDGTSASLLVGNKIKPWVVVRSCRSEMMSSFLILMSCSWEPWRNNLHINQISQTLRFRWNAGHCKELSCVLNKGIENSFFIPTWFCWCSEYCPSSRLYCELRVCAFAVCSAKDNRLLWLLCTGGNNFSISVFRSRPHRMQSWERMVNGTENGTLASWGRCYPTGLAKLFFLRIYLQQAVQHWVRMQLF